MGIMRPVSFMQPMLRGSRYSPPVILLHDTFTDTNGTLLTAHTPETGGPWVDLLAAHQIQSNVARRSGSGNPPFTAAECGYADINGTGTSNLSLFRVSGLCVRATNKDNLWYLMVYANNTNQYQSAIYEVNAGVFTSRASTAGALTTGTPFGVTFSAISNTITLTIDSVSTISYASATFNNTATKHGIASNTDTNGAGISMIRITG